MLKIGSNINEVRVDGNIMALQRDLKAFAGFVLGAAEISVHGLDTVKNGRLDRHRAAEIKKILGDYPFVYSTHKTRTVSKMEFYKCLSEAPRQ